MPTRTVHGLDLEPVKVSGERPLAPALARAWRTGRAGLALFTAGLLSCYCGLIGCVGAFLVLATRAIQAPSRGTPAAASPSSPGYLVLAAAAGVVFLVATIWLQRLHASACLLQEARLHAARKPDQAWSPEGERRRPSLSTGPANRRSRRQPVPRLEILGWVVVVSIGVVLKAPLVIAGCFLVYWVFRHFRRRGFGELVVTCTRVPFRVGETVKILLRADERSSGFEELHASLLCVQQSPARPTPQVPRPLGTVTHVLWGERIEFEPPHELPAPGSDVELTFHPPVEAPATDFSQVVQTHWELRVQGDAGGGWFDERFLVPVYGAPGVTEATPGAEGTTPPREA